MVLFLSSIWKQKDPALAPGLALSTSKTRVNAFIAVAG
jgi:hypothetical protein